MLLQRYILQLPKFIGLELTAQFIKYASTRDFEKAAVGQKGIINEKIRKVYNYPLHQTHKLLSACHWFNYFNNKITSGFNYYLDQQNLIQHSKIPGLNQLDILKYEETFHYKYHVDDGIKTPRVMSGILFLNNDYEGGDLCFKNTFDDEEISIKPTPGTLVVWPSCFLFPHTVKPITKGIRYSLVAWA
jgi:hypothetical protein